jgi:hypothetical protein
MHVVSVKKPSAGIRSSLGIRGFTQERNPMDAVNVVKPSSESHSLLNIR